jgi:hypothetical protein
MTRYLRALVNFTLTITVLVLLAAPPATAQPRPGFAKEGGFASVTVIPNFTFDGETFDGLTFYQEIDGDEIVLLPRLKERHLVRFALGYRARQGALEISYDRTQHDGTFEDFPVESTFQAVNVDGRFFFATSQRIQPHILVGGSYPWLRIKDGGVLGDAVGDARFKGYGVNAEAGVTVYPHPQLGIGVGYGYRVLWFESVRGVTDTLFELRPRFRETRGSVVLTGAYTF